MKTYNTKEIMKKAHEIFNASKRRTFSQALKLAWKLAKFTLKASQEVVTFAYRKIDGSYRTAIGILKDVKIASEEKIQRYWDIEKNAYRCFLKINFINIL